MKAVSIKKVNQYLALLPENKLEEVVNFIFYLAEREEFSDAEVKKILKARKDSEKDSGVEWTKIRRNDL